MKHSGKTIRFIQFAIAALTASVITTSSAGSIFPPDHRHEDARFTPGTNSVESFAEPWYHSVALDTRERLIAGDLQTASPHPSNYYFVKNRKFGNPKAGRPVEIPGSGFVPEVKLVDKSNVAVDES